MLTLRPSWPAGPGSKINSYDMHLSLAFVGESCIRYVALLIEGRLRRQSRWRSKAWRPAAAACNRRLGRQGTPPARHYDLAARSIAATDAEEMPQTEARPRPKIATVERREARVPASWGRRRFRKSAKACPSSARRGCASCTRAPLGAPPPLDRVGREGQTPGAMRRGNERGCADGTSRNASKRQGGKRALSLARPFWPNKANGQFARRNDGLRPVRSPTDRAGASPAW